MSTAEMLDQVLDPLVDSLTTEGARKLVALRADLAVQAKLDELADRANEGALSSEEKADYEKLRATFHIVTLLQSKARHFLSNHTAQ